ncbi:UDP-N-acetylmuramoyl-tripeptide--D-alanyl-D-alanine ligase [Roseiterribacter gracilis]|uniref:UDP-N-acetylmuramoyl-tripeptide--D-alanyl-D-alanine ligase n=1 Tax=Roseiterribacter gracilis TaxID=2812848 RepID=A0A8S8X7Q7_9PROT|nr:UDP-N-acetylmuramoyl-tripeptide--D-alanyl-D-alanine ligase [Rhodospirillales bacterium TMPK1]
MKVAGPDILWTAEEAALATAGLAIQPWNAKGISIDTRTCKPGDLFVALRGPSFDGHKFVAQAAAAGAVAAMVDESVEGDIPLLSVNDTMTGLADLARGARDRSRAKLVAITGSVGKTSTKEALAAVLRAQGKTHASEGNLNNHWGLPLSLARMPSDTRYAVLEMGMNHAGEIEKLSNIAAPDIAVITNVEPAHIGHFRDLEAVADAKAEIFTGIRKGGIAILNRDNGQYDRLADRAHAAGVKQILTFGSNAQCDAQLLQGDVSADGSFARARLFDRELEFHLQNPGRHQLFNALAVLLAATQLGADPLKVAEDLSKVPAVKGRGVKVRAAIPGGGITLIDESYNASPASVGAALSVLGLEQPAGEGRRIAVLGDMKELGNRSVELHAKILADLVEAKVDLVFACGQEILPLVEAMPLAMAGWHSVDSVELAAIVAERVRPGDVVLVKGSASMRMDRVVEALVRLAPNKKSGG